MTEADWLACDEPQRMLSQFSIASRGRGFFGVDVSRPRPSDRKLRLFACACCRHNGASTEEADRWEREGDPMEQSAMDWAVHWAAPAITDYPAAARAALLRDIVGNPWRPVQLQSAWLTPIVQALARAAYEERGRKCEHCCGKGGLEYEPGCVVSECRWCHGAGRTDDGTLDPQRLLVLSDALEEAGCDDETILRHLRGEEPYVNVLLSGPKRPILIPRRWRSLRGPHVRGCWVLDLLLGKE